MYSLKSNLWHLFYFHKVLKNKHRAVSQGVISSKLEGGKIA